MSHHAWSDYPCKSEPNSHAFRWVRNEEKQWLEFLSPGGTTMAIVTRKAFDDIGEPYIKHIEEKFWKRQQRKEGTL